MSMPTRNTFAAMLLVLCMSSMTAYAIEIDAAALYRFEEDADTIAVGEFLTDVSGNERHAEAFNDVIGLVAGQARLGQAGSFNQSVAVVDFEDVDTSGDFTFAFWMKSATLGQTQVYLLSLNNGSGGGEQTAVIYQYEQNTVELYSGNSATDLRPGSQLSVPDTEWHHIVYTRSGADYDAYLDGVKHDIATLDGPVHNPQYLSLGGTGHLRAGGPVNFYEGLLDDVLVMTRGVAQAEVDFIMRGFTNELAYAPSPGDGADDVLRDQVLTWEPGMYAARHNVYLGADADQVNEAGMDSDLLVGQGQANASYDAGALDFGQSYYWRVDEVNGAPDHTIFKGDVWHFTVEPYSIPISVHVDRVTASSSTAANPPSLTVDGSGLDGDAHSTNSDTMWLSAATDISPWLMVEFDKVEKLDKMLIWNSNSNSEGFIGWGIKDVNIETSPDGVNWTGLAESSQISRAPGLPGYDTPQMIDLGLALAKYVRINILSNWGGLLTQYGVSEVRFYGLPVYARTPDPASGSTDILPQTVVTWRAGREADQHTIYMSTDPDAVADGTASAVSSGIHSLDLDSLDLHLDETYYWRVDEVNETEPLSVWDGPVWSFSTVSHVTLDDFESYTNFSPNRPFQTWLDGFGYSADQFIPVAYAGNGTGSGVGHDIWSVASPHFNGTIMETTLVKSGSQSMPFYYDNSIEGVSEITRQFTESQNWATKGIKSLSIAFYGEPNNTGELYVKINDTRIAYSGDPDNMAANMWHTWDIDLTTLNSIDNVTSLTLGVAGATAAGVLYLDDMLLSPRDAVADNWGDTLTISAYEWAPGAFLKTPDAPDYWGSDVDMTKLTDGVIASDYSGGLCAGWNFSTADGPFGPTLYFDLGSIQPIGAVAIYHQPKYYGFETVKVSVSTQDNPNRSDINDMADWTGEAIHTSDHWGAADSGNAPSVMQVVPIRQEGRWVRLQFLNEEPGYDTAWTMFSEFVFYAE